MKKLNVKTVVFAGVLIAVNIILKRLFAIELGPDLRIDFGDLPIFLAGIWMGPVVGGICGGVADFLGCIIKGWAVNPFILLASMFAGVLGGIFKQYVFKGKLDSKKIAVIVCLHGLIGSMVLTTIGLHIQNGTPYIAMIPSRIIKTICLVIANTILVSILYKSELTKYVRDSLRDRRNTKAK